DIQCLQARHFPDLQHQGGRVGQARLPVREMPDQAGAEREREQEGRNREQVSHPRQHIARPRETFAYLDLRRRSLYGAPPIASEEPCRSASCSRFLPSPLLAPAPTTTRCPRSSRAHPSLAPCTTAAATPCGPAVAVRRARRR